MGFLPSLLGLRKEPDENELQMLFLETLAQGHARDRGPTWRRLLEQEEQQRTGRFCRQSRLKEQQRTPA